MSGTRQVRSKRTRGVNPLVCRALGMASIIWLSQTTGAETYRVTSFSIDGGGGSSGSGRFRVEGTVGNPTVGPPLIGVKYQVAGGIMELTEPNMLGESPILSIQWVEPARVRISWADKPGTWQLERGSISGTSGWTPVPGAVQAPVLLPSSESAAMFRLRLKP